MRGNRTVILWVCASFGVGGLAAPSARAELGFKGDIDLLRMTALAQRDNVQRISTWQGSSSVEESSEDAQGATIREQSMFHFVFSREHEATRWEWKGQSRYVRQGLTVGGRLVDPNWWSSWANEMRKGDTFYKYELGRITKEGQKAGTLVIWPSQQAETGAYSYSFDPMWYLKGRITAGADDLADLLMEYYEQSSDRSFRESDCTLKVSRDADLVIFETRGENVLNRFVFDLSKEGSPIKVLIESSMGTQTREWTYEQRGDVWVPKSFTYTSEWLQAQPNGETKLTRKVTFTENVLNRPVAATEFSLDKLGLKVGDPVSDHKLGFRYQYGGYIVARDFAQLSGKSLPDMKELAVGSDPNQTKGKMMLVCFFDMNQRPSRNCVQQLSKRAQELKAKDLVVVAVQASQVDQNALGEWVKKNNISFAVGMVQGDEEKTRFAWGVKSLPWLILTDKNHVVCAEGFAVSELEQRIRE